jgi:HSP20 family protein
MTLVRYEPWRLVNRLHQQLDQVLGDTFGTSENSDTSPANWSPAVDIREENDRFLVFADVPGVDRKDIEITAEKGVLTIRGERKSEHREQHKGYDRVERALGSFVRRFTLPETANTEEIKAKQNNGVLEISIPKQPQLQPRRISIDS